MAKRVLPAILLAIPLVLASSSFGKASPTRSISTVVARYDNAITSKEDRRFGHLEGFGTSGIKEIVGDDVSSLVSTYRPMKKNGIMRHKLATTFTVALFGSLLAGRSLCGEHYWVVVGVVVALYLGEAMSSSTRKYLSNMLSPQDVQEIVDDIRQTLPRLRWDLECYHYRYSRSYTSGKKQGAHESRTKVVTHHASQEYLYNTCLDKTETKDLFDKLYFDPNSQKPFLKISIGKLLLFRDLKCYQDYLGQHGLFLVREGNRDHYTDSTTRFKEPKFRNKLLTVRTVIGVKDNVRLFSFWLFSLLGLTVPYRIWFNRHCDEANLLVVKEVT